MAAPQRNEGFVASLFRGSYRQLKFFIGEARRYSELRQTPYGMQPFVVITVIGVFLRFEGQAIGVALPDIGQDLRISIGSLISLEAMVAAIGICVGVFVA